LKIWKISDIFELENIDIYIYIYISDIYHIVPTLLNTQLYNEYRKSTQSVFNDD